MPQFKVGIIGYGGFGQFLHRAWSSHGNVQVVAVSDQRELIPPQGVEYFSDWRDLLQNSDIDIVSIVTPPSSHSEIALASLKQEKHVLIEKPLATTMKAAREVLSAARVAGSTAGVDYMLRFNPLVAALLQISNAGMFGPLRRIIIENYASDETLNDSHWFWDRSISGGIFVEHGVHFLDLATLFAGSSDYIISGMPIPQQNRENRVTATVIYENGVTATHYHDFSRPGIFEQTSVRFIYPLAEVQIDGWIPLTGTLRVLVNDEILAQLQSLPGFAIQSQKYLRDIEDTSRPEGWGNQQSVSSANTSTIRSGGNSYQVDRMITAIIDLKMSKADAYQLCLRRLQEDFLQSIIAGSEPAANLESALISLQMAIEAGNRQEMTA